MMMKSNVRMKKNPPPTHEENAHPTFNGVMSSIVGVEDKCKPIKALQVLSIEPKTHVVTKAN